MISSYRTKVAHDRPLKNIRSNNTWVTQWQVVKLQQEEHPFWYLVMSAPNFQWLQPAISQFYYVLTLYLIKYMNKKELVLWTCKMMPNRFIVYCSIFRPEHKNKSWECIAFNNLKSIQRNYPHKTDNTRSSEIILEIRIKPLNLIFVLIIFKCQSSQRSCSCSLHLCISEPKQFNKRRNTTLNPSHTK